MKMNQLLMKTCIAGMLLAGCTTTDQPGMEQKDPLKVYKNLPEENRYQLLEDDSLKAKVENGTGIIVMAQKNEDDSPYAVYAVHDLLETYDMSAGYYEVVNEKDPSIVSLVKNNLSGGTFYVDDDVSCPIVLFVQKGEIVNLFDDDYFEDHPSYAVPQLQKAMESMQLYLEDQKVDACDEGCQLGG